MATTFVVLCFDKCDHLPEGKRFVSVTPGYTLKSLFEKCNSTVSEEKYSLKAFSNLGTAGEFLFFTIKSTLGK